jgi:RNA polymerase sigma-70 factor (ECF subfamily)
MTTLVALNPENWLRDYGDVLYRYAFVRVRTQDIAEDLVQETLLSALEGVDKFNQKSSIRSWLVSILKHKIMDHYRKSQRELPLLTEQNLGEALLQQQFDDKGHWKTPLLCWESPEKSLDNAQFWETFYKCQSALPDTMARLFVLKVIEGLSTQECCELLNFKTENQLWIALSRTRMKLRKCLTTHWFHQGDSPC